MSMEQGNELSEVSDLKAIGVRTLPIQLTKAPDRSSQTFLLSNAVPL